ncbi:hypothetical protein LTR56_000582 [Elasticomyces elasticus]|nr:hypothetical protein LTR56_000582 [Elasticomyces elasticus]KAK3664358.1 hypothetical protein LTR22_004771 [Elasticomyces elasticus]KAK4915468.1 hypothetical protein LTR49_016456 [Elasticomyces elasticus]KAK5737176.1 hypothetical protein LTS12_025966 [Elasticomyces elasticus]
MQLQPGQSPPFAVITEDDQRGVVYITSGLALATALVCLVVRAYVRMGLGQAVGKDDYAIVASFLFMIAQSIALFAATANGLGETSTSVKRGQEESMQKALLAVDVLYILTLWSSRCSSVLFFERLSRGTRHELVWTGMLGGTAVLGTASVFTVVMRCNMSNAWLFIDQHCTGLLDRWIAVTVFDILFEIVLFSHPAYMVANLQMARKTKVNVIGAFAGRLLIIIPLALHLSTVRSFYSWTNGAIVSSYDTAAPFIYTQITLALSIIMPTIPMLQPFLQATATTFGMVSGMATNSYGEGGSKQSRGISKTTSVHQVISSRSFRRGSTQHQSAIMSDREAGRQYSAAAFHERRPSNSSDVSQQPMIRRDAPYVAPYSNDPA